MNGTTFERWNQFWEFDWFAHMIHVLYREFNHFSNTNPMDLVLSIWVCVGLNVVNLKTVKNGWIELYMQLVFHIHLLEPNDFDLTSLPLTCKQFNHSDSVIFLSLFTSQYRGIFLPHFFNALRQNKKNSISYLYIRVSTVERVQSYLADMTNSRNIFHSLRSHTLFLFLSNKTKLSVATRSSSLAQCVVFALKIFI